MKHRTALAVLIPAIAVLALFAAAAGLFFETPGARYPYTNHRGETVLINGHGLYAYDTVRTAAQMRGNDLITLIVGVPLLLVAAWLARRGSLRGRLLLTGTVGFFLYTYMSMSMLAAFNSLFLVYVALFGLSLYAFILCMMSFDLADLPRHFDCRLPRGWIAGLMFFVSAFLAMAWLQRALSPVLSGAMPALENTTTLVIQAMDLVLVAPLAALAGILLLRRSPWGYLLSAVFVLKAITMGLGVSVMVINMTLSGVPDSPAVMVPFLVITIVNLVLAVVLLRHVHESAPPAVS